MGARPNAALETIRSPEPALGPDPSGPSGTQHLSSRQCPGCGDPSGPEAEVVSSGIVRSGEDRVQILVFVDRPTTNKLSREPVVYKDQVTVTMQKVEDEWLVDDMVTSPPQQ